MDRILHDIRNLKDSNNTDREIMEILAIPTLTTYHRYLSKIHKQNKEAWLRVTMDEYETELLKLKGSLEDTYRKAKAISESENDVLSVLEACQAKDDARLSIVHLLTEGPEMIKRVEGLLSENKKKRKMDIQREEQEETSTT